MRWTFKGELALNNFEIWKVEEKKSEVLKPFIGSSKCKEFTEINSLRERNEEGSCVAKTVWWACDQVGRVSTCSNVTLLFLWLIMAVLVYYIRLSTQEVCYTCLPVALQ